MPLAYCPRYVPNGCFFENSFLRDWVENERSPCDSGGILMVRTLRILLVLLKIRVVFWKGLHHNREGPRPMGLAALPMGLVHGSWALGPGPLVPVHWSGALEPYGSMVSGLQGPGRPWGGLEAPYGTLWDHVRPWGRP